MSGNNNKIIAISIFLFVVIAWGLTYWYASPLLFNNKGAFGDTFGIINALFSGLALAGVIYAILLQRDEIKAQRDAIDLQRKSIDLQQKELKRSNKEMALQSAALQAQERALKSQLFESSFYNLLKSQQDIVNSIKEVRETGLHTNNTNVYKEFIGRSALNLMNKELKIIYFGIKLNDKQMQQQQNIIGANWGEVLTRYGIFQENIRDALKIECESDDIKILQKSFNILFEAYHQHLGHYFRNLYQVLSYITNAKAEAIKQYENNYGPIEGLDEERLEYKYKKYSDTVKAQMSSDELRLCFYYGLVYDDQSKPMYERHKLVENLSSDDLLDKSHDGLYEGITHKPRR